MATLLLFLETLIGFLHQCSKAMIFLMRCLLSYFLHAITPPKPVISVKNLLFRLQASSSPACKTPQLMNNLLYRLSVCLLAFTLSTILLFVYFPTLIPKLMQAPPAISSKIILPIPCGLWSHNFLQISNFSI